MGRFFKNFAIVAIVSLIFQFAWEYLVCDIFYTMENITNPNLLLASATFGDVMMSVALYTLLALVNYDVDWIIKDWKAKDFVIILLYGLFLSFYFEVHALYTGRWGYSEAMPLFPNTNIGLMPVIQLLILFPLSFFISRLIIRATTKKKRYYF